MLNLVDSIKKIRQIISPAEKYFLFLLVFNVFFIGLFYYESPITLNFAQSGYILAFGGIVFLLQYLHVNVKIHGSALSIDLNDPFVLCLFFIHGPLISLSAYALGIAFYQPFRRLPDPPFNKLPLRPLIATPLVNTFNYGVAFFAYIFLLTHIVGSFYLFLRLGLVLFIQTIADFVTTSKYRAIIRQKSHWEILKAELSSDTLWIRFLAILVFPALSYIAIIFWEAGFYVSAILLFAPFLLVRTAMKGIPQIVDEIITTTEAIVNIIDAKDPYTHHHCNRVALYAMVIGTFCGLNEGIIERIGRAARLHDIGKILTADRVLKKDSKLSDAEYEHIKQHTDPKKNLMTRIPEGTPLKDFFELGRHHHERFDGTGYPDGWKGTQIPLETRVISMADAWDAMTSNRVYRQGLSREAALAEVEKSKGRQWDPKVVEGFLDAQRAGALEQIVENPNLLQNPPRSWNIQDKHLEPAVGPAAKTKILNFLSAHRQPIFFFLMSALLFAGLFFMNASPYRAEPILLYAFLAVLLECLEMKFPKLPMLSPAESVYLASLFVFPLTTTLVLILAGSLAHALYTGKLKAPEGFQMIRRLILFCLSKLFFSALGNAFLSIPLFRFKDLPASINLLAIFLLWGILYALGDFLLQHAGAMLKRRLLKISPHWPSLQYSILFHMMVIVPFGFILSAFHDIEPAGDIPYLFLSALDDKLWASVWHSFLHSFSELLLRPFTAA